MCKHVGVRASCPFAPVNAFLLLSSYMLPLSVGPSGLWAMAWSYFAAVRGSENMFLGFMCSL